MDHELEAPPPDDTRVWRRSLAMLALLIALVVAAQVYGVRVREKDELKGSAARDQSLISGDFYVKMSLARPSPSLTRRAFRSYREALPWPSAYRRLGVLSEATGKSGLPYFRSLDSKPGVAGLTKKQVAELRAERAMWRRILSGHKPSTGELRRDVARIENLNLGPLKNTALSMAYRHAGLTHKARAIASSDRASARASLGASFLLLSVLIVGGIGGFFGAIIFLAEAAPRFAAAPKLPLQSSMLMTSFIVYLASYIGLSGMTEVAADALGISSISKWSGAAYTILVVLSAGVAFCLGLLTLAGRARELGQDWRQIGFRTVNAGRSALLGLKGYFAALPFVFIAGVIAAILSRTVFRHIQTPEQPLDEIITQGGIVDIILVFLAASVVAPIVEETFFRGVLYGTFRTKMNVWPSVLLTSAIFAIIHPLPGGFLPIFALACVLAVLRERSGSLLPGMVCHGIHNTVVLLLTTLIR